MENQDVPEVDAYWRSSAGDDEWERILEGHLAKIKGEPSDFELFKRFSFDVAGLSYGGDTTRRLFVTWGFSHFILGWHLAGTRHELCWVVPPEVAKDRAADALYDLAEAVLEKRRILDDDELIAEFSLAPYLPEGATVTCPLIKFQFWLDPEDAHLESHYPLWVAEVVPITPDEAKLHQEDPSRFWQRYDDEQIDLANFFRK